MSYFYSFLYFSVKSAINEELIGTMQGAGFTKPDYSRFGSPFNILELLVEPLLLSTNSIQLQQKQNNLKNKR